MINRILYRARAIITAFWKRLRKSLKNLGWKKGSILTIAGLVILLGGSSYLRSSGTSDIAPQDTTRSVTLASVSELSQEGTSFSVGGVIQSQTEATVRAEKSGKVTAVYYGLGDFVTAGAIVAELENASERAALLQAQGSLEAATASAQVSQTTLAAAKGVAVNTLLSAYAATDNAVHADIDLMFSNPESSSRQFNVESINSQAKIDTLNKRGLVIPILSRQQARSTTLSTSDDLVAELKKTEGELRVIRDFLDTIITTLNASIVTDSVTEATIATYKATATAARTTITSSLSAVVSATQTLDTAQQNTGDNSSAASASSAALTQAQGALAAARANLERTIIRAPISGTLNSLALDQGNFIQAASPVLTVANNRALEAIAYITAQDISRIAVGGKATLEGSVTGIITRIAPAIDPLTKKIEVHIGLPTQAGLPFVSKLVNGQSVVIAFEKAAITSTKPLKGPITIPIAALKIGSENIVVFTVDTEQTLIPHEIELGTLLGDRVEIKSGLTSDMRIVTDARGLQAGEKVIVKE